MSDVHNGGYTETIESAVRSALAVGDATIGDIAARLGDVDPTQILKIVEDFGREDVVLNSAGALGAVRDHKKHSISLPIPHPLDYDWRLADTSIESTGPMLESVCGAAPLCLVGVPTIFRYFVETDGPIGGAHLYDRNESSIRACSASLPQDSRYSAFLRDVYNSLPVKENYGAAFLDPPWYLEDSLSFLYFASVGCMIGSAVYLSAPGMRTRPGIAEERAAMFSRLADLGLRLCGVREDALIYETPPFERRAFRKMNIDVPDLWRRGTLLHFEKVSAPAPRLNERSKSEAETWGDVEYAGVRFRVRQRAEASDSDPTLRPAVEGAILPSVSRRDLRRASVDVWTSGNSVYLCTGPSKLLCVLRALAAGEEVREAVGRLVGRRLSANEERQIDAVEAQIAEIVAAERGL